MENNEGCKAFVEKDQICGETRNLEILREFRQLYEDKLQKIDNCECDSSQIKIQMLQDWVKDLTEQNTLLVQVVEELEHEAAERVLLLEERLKHSSNASFDIMKSLQEYDITKLTDRSDILRNLSYLQNDQKNLLNFIKRARDEGVWSTEGLRFYFISEEDISGNSEPYGKSDGDNIPPCHNGRNNSDHEVQKLKDALQSETHKHQLQLIQDLQRQLKLKSDDYIQLEKSMKDMREALTAEVADKYDNIVALRRECQLLQEQCQQADKQTHFKDDIIKEMRKELKQLRVKLDSDIVKENENMKKRVDELEEENNFFRSTISDAEEELTALHKLIDSYLIGNKEFEETLWKCASGFKNYCHGSDLRNEYVMNVNENLRRKLANTKLLLKKSVKTNKYCMEEIDSLNSQNREQSETIELLKSKLHDNNIPGDKVLALYENKNDSFNENETDSGSGSLITGNEFGKTIYLLKSDINKMIQWHGSEYALQELNKRISEFEDSLQDLEKKDQLINNKDEMIKLQSETLNLVQVELKELRSKLVDYEMRDESRTQEIYNLQQALKINQNTITELESALKMSEEKVDNMQQAVELYMATINIIETAKNKAEVEIEQQRITIGNLQDALVNTKHHLEEVQGKHAIDIQEKNDAIYLLHQDLIEMQSQYVDCYGQIVKLSQFTDCLRRSNYELKMTAETHKKDIEKILQENESYKNIIELLEDALVDPLFRKCLLESDVLYLKKETSGFVDELKVAIALMNLSDIDLLNNENIHLIHSLGALQDHSASLIDRLEYMQHQMVYDTKWKESICCEVQNLQKLVEIKKAELHKYEEELKFAKAELNELSQRNKEYENKIQIMEKERGDYEVKANNYEKELMNYSKSLTEVQHRLEVLNDLVMKKSEEIYLLQNELSKKTEALHTLKEENQLLKEKAVEENTNLCQNIESLQEQLIMHNSVCVEMNEKYNKTLSDLEFVKQRESKLQNILMQEKKMLLDKLDSSNEEAQRLSGLVDNLKHENENLKKEYNIAKENIISLKNEIIKATKTQEDTVSEKQMLEQQLKNSNLNLDKYSVRNEYISQKLDECLKELSVLQLAKEKLEERNAQLQLEIESVLKTFNDLNQEIRNKNESVLSLEQELAECRSSKEEVCIESRTVVTNVRSWLREQQKVNESLNLMVKEKNTQIEELKAQKTILITNIKEVSEKYDALFHEMELCKEYLRNQNKYNPLPIVPRSVFTWGSQGSTSSETSSPIMDNIYEIDDEYPVNETKYNPERWARVVEEVNDDMEKPNRHWEGHHKSHKKTKPTKMNKAKSS